MNPNDSMHTVLGQEHSSEEFLLSSAVTVTTISKVPLSKTIIYTYRHLLRGRCLTGKNVNHKTFGHMGIGNYKVFSV